MTPTQLRAWRIYVNWSQDQLARALGYAQKAIVSRWESGATRISPVVDLAVQWLMHTTPGHRPVSPLAQREANHSKRRWTPAEIDHLIDMNTARPGAVIEMAIKLRRSESGVTQKLTRLRLEGRIPLHTQAGLRRGAYGRRGPEMLPGLSATD